jgi:hypothetical protein
MMVQSDLKLSANVIEFQVAKAKHSFGDLHAAKKRTQPVRNPVMPQAF